MLRPTVLDGGLATALQRVGLAPFSPVEPWLLERPHAIVAAHSAFVDAGAEIVLTATFRCLPSERKDWRQLVPIAIDLAREASQGRAAVWLSLGPGTGHRDVVQVAADAVDGIVLETFSDGDAALGALANVRQSRVPVVLSVVPHPETLRVGSHRLEDLARAALGQGAAGFGVNCVSGPLACRAIDRIPSEVRVWAKPSGDADQSATFARLLGRAEWLGGCCGTGPEAIRALVSSRSAG